MSKSVKESSGNDSLKQTKMGQFFAKDSGSEKSEKKKRKVPVTGASMWSSFWTRGSYKDTEEYRNRYPGKKDDSKSDANYRFYMNEIPSKPDGDLIDNIHDNWFGAYDQLEIHHGYIQWLFPIRDTGMNWHAKELQLHEIEKLVKNEKAKERILKSYKMMLDFYGMVLKDESTGEIARAENWKERFRHLNRSYHNYLRITRILKSLGEFEFEHLKANFVRFILHEGMVEHTLDNLIDSCCKYWIGVLRNDQERESVLNFYEELIEKQKEDDGKAKKRSSSTSPKPVVKFVHKYDGDSDQEADIAQYDNMDLHDDTLPFENDLDKEDYQESETAEKDIKPSGKQEGNLRIIHSMSDSDSEGCKTPEVDGSQEANYWAKRGETIDGAEADEEDKNRKNSETVFGDSGEQNEAGKEQTNENETGKKVFRNQTNNEERVTTYKDAESTNEDLCSDQVDNVISSKDKKHSDTESDERSALAAKEILKQTCDKDILKQETEENAMDGVTDDKKEDKVKETTHSVNLIHTESTEEMPMETGDDGSVNV